jgi:type I phosphodiesterase/nucleotide pyrophosphatase
MRFLRMLSNALIAGALGATYLTILVLHLNPSFPLSPTAVVPLLMTMSLAYGLPFAIGCYVLIVIRQMMSPDLLSPGWLSVRVLSWLCTMTAAGGATIMWLNLRAFATVLDPQTVTRMTAGTVTLSASAVVFLLIAFAHLGRRGGNASAVLLTAMMAISIAAPLAARGKARENTVRGGMSSAIIGAEPGRDAQVVVLALDGATLDVISPAVAEGRLPGFGRIFDGGAVLHLATLRPTQPEPVWSTVMTGRVPGANGIRAAALYRVGADTAAIEVLPDYCFAQSLVRFGLLIDQAHPAKSLRARPLWNILSDAGVPVGFIGWPLTHPAPIVNGFMVSDEFHRLEADDTEVDQAVAVAPATLLDEVRTALRGPIAVDPFALVSKMAEAPQGDVDARPDPAPLAADRMHLQILDALANRTGARFLAVRLPGVDAVGHYFLRYAEPSAFGDVSEAELRQYGRVLDEYYGFIDAVVGRLIDGMRPDDLLVVISGFGMEPLSPGKRMLERIVGNVRISGTHERSPDGFLLAYGTAVARGRPARASLLDFAPTMLYYLGLPVARDMEGFARTDLFRPDFTASRPITFIPTYGR